MKKYNIQNYVRYKKEVDKLSRKLEKKDWSECDRDELVIKNAEEKTIKHIEQQIANKINNLVK